MPLLPIFIDFKPQISRHNCKQLLLQYQMKILTCFKNFGTDNYAWKFTEICRIEFLEVNWLRLLYKQNTPCHQINVIIHRLDFSPAQSCLRLKKHSPPLPEGRIPYLEKSLEEKFPQNSFMKMTRCVIKHALCVLTFQTLSHVNCQKCLWSFRPALFDTQLSSSPRGW